MTGEKISVEKFNKLCREVVLRRNPHMKPPARRGIRAKGGEGILLIDNGGDGYLYRFLWDREVHDLKTGIDDFFKTIERVSRLYPLKKKVLMTRFKESNIVSILEMNGILDSVRNNCIEITGIEKLLEELALSFGITSNDLTEEDLDLFLDRVEKVKRMELFARYQERNMEDELAEQKAGSKSDELKPPPLLLLKENSSFSPETIRRIKESYLDGKSLPIEGEFDDLVVLMADMCSFTTFMRNSRDFLLIKEMMQLFYRRMRQEIFKHHGILDKFIGDGLLAIFGYPFKEGDYWIDASNCALDMVNVGKEIGNLWQEKIDVMVEDIGLRVGLSLGRLLIVWGEEGEGELIILGDPINLASRLQMAAKPNQILVSNKLSGYLKGNYILRRNVMEAKGIGDVVAWELCGKRGEGETK